MTEARFLSGAIAVGLLLISSLLTFGYNRDLQAAYALAAISSAFALLCVFLCNVEIRKRSAK